VTKRYQKPWKEHPKYYERTDELLSSLGISFKNKEFLYEALTHRSVVNQAEALSNQIAVMPWNERLEFLGDSVLNFCVTQHIYQQFPEVPEGDLSRIRAGLVSEKSLSEIAKNIHLPDYIVVGKSELTIRGQDRPSLHADTLEALFGAILLDSGLDVVSRLIANLFENSFASIGRGEDLASDYKTEFQELIQEKTSVTPTYRVVEESGPAHNRRFVVAAIVEEEEWARGSGENKKSASQAAAKIALEVFKKKYRKE